MNDNALLNFIKSERYILVGLGCAVIVLACVLIAFVAIWRQFPATGSSPSTTRAANAATPPVHTQVSPTASLPGLANPSPTTAPGHAPAQPSLPGVIAYVCFQEGFDQICRMNPDGGEQVRLTFSLATDFYPSVSPDGDSVVFSSRRDGRFEIYELNLATNSQTRLTDQIGSAFAPEISPDGRFIAFTNAIGGNQSIWIMNRDGSSPKRLTDDRGEDIDPTWSPDGRAIAFASTRSGQETQLHIIDLATQEIRVVTNGVPGIGGRSDWSPDGSILAFYAGPQDGREIFIVNIDGSNLRQITSEGDNLAPSFSPDGTWIVFTSHRTGNDEIFRMRVNGQEISQLTNNDHPDWQPRWGP